MQHDTGLIWCTKPALSISKKSFKWSKKYKCFKNRELTRFLLFSKLRAQSFTLLDEYLLWNINGGFISLDANTEQSLND